MKRILATAASAVLAAAQLSAFEPDTLRLTNTVPAVLEPIAEVADAHPVHGLERRELLTRAAALKDVYDFAGARALYEKVLRDETDSASIASVVAMKVLVDNGLGMMDYVVEPTVLARHRFSRRDFFLFYPLEDKSWVLAPNALDDGNTGATYAPEGVQRLAWSHRGGSAEGEDGTHGSMDICISTKLDSTWTAPAVPREEFASDGNEIWPVFSADGKSLYFSSDGLYGVGGYDIYVSHLNEETGEWGAPVNLGFPFSSPADDFLYMDTPDEKYTVFASNRACSADSVDVYVLEYEPMPLRKRISDPVQLCGLAALNPVENTFGLDNGNSTSAEVEENADIARYMDKMTQVRALRDSLALAMRELNERRVAFATSDDDDLRAALTEDILLREDRLPELQEASAKALAELQSIEMDFLFKGVVIDPDKLMKNAEREVVGATAAYTFSRMEPGSLPELVFE